LDTSSEGGLQIPLDAAIAAPDFNVATKGAAAAEAFNIFRRAVDNSLFDIVYILIIVYVLFVSER
jgi:hypothetical protein